mmetsp:Transcript_120286/g.347628  ORF Transcript_120286/g.347628 Transcript_120286/m.347628 type:complete len:273 (-) Transcript_120286:160-978(-)
MRVFMSFYILWLLVLVAYFLNYYMEKIAVEQSQQFAERIEQVGQTAVMVRLHNEMRRAGEYVEAHDFVHLAIAERLSKRKAVIRAGMVFFAHIMFGTFFYHWLEECTCSYGQTEIGNCTLKDACEVGERKSLASSFYMSMVTLTTVGFGDTAPGTKWGRIIGIPWMLSGVMSTAKFVEAIQSSFLEPKVDEDLSDERVSVELLQKLGHDQSGHLSRGDFVSFILVKHGIVDREILDHVHKLYETMDADHDGQVTVEEVARFHKAVTTGRESD